MGIKEIRKELGLTQVAFAHMFGVHQTAVSQWETGRTCPDFDTVIQIARATGHSMDEVLGVYTGRAPIVQRASMEFEMKDDSMAGAYIQKGDVLYVSGDGEAIEDASLVCVRGKSGVTARFIRYIGEKAFFLDAQIPAGMYAKEEEDKILGTVVGVYKDLEVRK